MKNKIITYSNLSRFLITLIVLISSVVISSCSVFSPIATVDIHKFQITLDNNSNIQNSVCTKDSNLNHNNIPENKLVLQLMPIKANAPYDTVRMYYSKSKYELDNYLYNEWVTPPQNMLTQLVLQELLNSCIYGNVINSSFLVNADYRLSIQILELKHIVMQDLDTKNSNTQNANNANKVSIKILVQLIDNHNNEIIKTNTFIKTSTANDTALGFVFTTNLLIKQFLDELIKWLK